MIKDPQLLTLTRYLAFLAAPAYTGTSNNDFLLAGIASLSDLTGDPLNVLAGDGNDTVVGGSQTGDALAGQAGDDVLYGDSFGSFSLFNSGGNDILIGGEGNDKLYGQAGDDSLYGGQGNDLLYGGTGNDTLSDEEGDDVLDGGTGSDTYFLDSTSTDACTVNLTTGIASAATTGNNKLLSIENIVSGLGNDILIGNAVANVIFGNFGADSITGGAGADTIVYGSRTDSLLDSRDVVYGFDFGRSGDKFDFGLNLVDSTGTTQLQLNAGSEMTLQEALSSLLRNSTFNGPGLDVDQAQLVTLTGTSIAGQYLVVDGNNVAGYQSDGDFVIELVGALNTGSFGVGNFVG